MIELTLVRHAPTPMNEAGRYQGWTDPDLSPAGRERARTLGRELREGPWSLEGGATVVSSDLLRARRTAELAFPDHAIRHDPRLRELRMGIFEGHTWEENRRRHGEAFRRWREHPDLHAPPEGEALPEFHARIEEWLESLSDPCALVVVTHGGVLRYLAARLAGRPHPPGILGHFPPGSVLRTSLEDSP